MSSSAGTSNDTTTNLKSRGVVEVEEQREERSDGIERGCKSIALKSIPRKSPLMNMSSTYVS